MHQPKPTHACNKRQGVTATSVLHENGALDLGALPPKRQKQHHNAQAGGLIARLAVDKRYARQGYGEFLLVDALQNLLLASEMVGFPLVVVDAKDEATQFYARFGFTAFTDTPNKLFITLADVCRTLGKHGC